MTLHHIYPVVQVGTNFGGWMMALAFSEVLIPMSNGAAMLCEKFAVQLLLAACHSVAAVVVWALRSKRHWVCPEYRRSRVSLLQFQSTGSFVATCINLSLYLPREQVTT